MSTMNGEALVWERRDAPLGTLIVRAGLLPTEHVERALAEAVEQGRRLGEVLVQKGWLDEQRLTRLLAEQAGLPVGTLRGHAVDREAVRLLSAEAAWLNHAIPVAFQDGVPIVAIDDPSDESAIRNVTDAVGRRVRFVVVSPTELRTALTDNYPTATPGTGASALPVRPEPDPVSPELTMVAGDLALPSAPAVPPPARTTAEDVLAPAPAPSLSHAPEPQPFSPPNHVAVPAAPPIPAPAPVPRPAVDAPSESLPGETVLRPTCRLVVRLRDGDRLDAGAFSEKAEAGTAAEALVEQIMRSEAVDRWPVVAGRFLRPETIVSIDVVDYA